MKVAWVHSFPSTVQNAGVFMYQLAEAMPKRLQIELIELDRSTTPGRYLASLRRLRAAAGRHDLVHAQYGSGCGFICSQLPGRKILTLRGSDWYGARGTEKDAHWLRAEVGTALSRYTLRKMDAVIVVSNRMEADVRRKGYRGKIFVLPDGINLDLFKPVDRRAARIALGAAEDETKWVLFSSVQERNPIKRPALAANVIAYCAERVPGLKLKVLTNVEHRNVPTLINACDALIVTSVHEGWPNIVKEALACNVPFVSTDVSDLREIAECEPSCRLASPTVEDLGNALLSTLEEERPDSLRRHVHAMSACRISDQLSRIYDEVVR